MQHNFKDLKIWARSKELAKRIYTLTMKLPESEKFGLQTQMRRSAVSVASNIAEGSKRGTKKDFAQFLRISEGSLAELQTQMIIANEIYGIDGSEMALREMDEIQNMIRAFTKSIS